MWSSVDLAVLVEWHSSPMCRLWLHWRGWSDEERFFLVFKEVQTPSSSLHRDFLSLCSQIFLCFGRIPLCLLSEGNVFNWYEVLSLVRSINLCCWWIVLGLLGFFSAFSIVACFWRSDRHVPVCSSAASRVDLVSILWISFASILFIHGCRMKGDPEINRIC